MRYQYILAAVLLILGIYTWNMAAEAKVLTECLESVTNGRELAQRGDGTDPLQKEIAEKILRFHILANSDSEEDQRVKRQVRDVIGRQMAPLLSGAQDLEQTKAIVESHMDEIVDSAEQVLMQEGYSYGASAELATVDFPVKTYGDYTFPAGEYEALEVTLGEGCGHNWWCVLYPNMCFQGTVYEIVGERADEALREVLTPEEYADVFNEGNLKIRFKFLEYFK